ncbi:MAG TPA: acyl carrier protein [Saprospiraceae bacterium]|nr:acyl carrier protein [Saprospiraceae bacterium]HMP12475.1 acyl carrier protein [Saprospiraceae bacterium]
MTTMTTTHDQVIHLISDICRIPSTRIHALTSLRDDLHLDTVDLTLLIASLENNFKVYLTVEEANAIETVQDVSHFMQRHAA